ncbi:MAG: signal recognition particle-docking protein FtsY [Spirochaetes bacterium]|nr:MAG: signal recognition particle-docking protein FtsY [Spirochaetota bacterium]
MRKKSLAERIRALFSPGKGGKEILEELEDSLIEGDIGAKTAMEIIDELDNCAEVHLSTREELQNTLKELLIEYLKEAPLVPEKGKINFFLILGVNGTGKTTTIAKLAYYFSRELGKEKILLSAADTFRAAAIDQLKLHGERLGIPVISQNPGADPGAVIFDSIQSARARGCEVVLADTAGRMHNRANLIRELQKIKKIVDTKVPGIVSKNILIIDATTGQNGFRQAEIFHQAVGIDSIILAKYDATSKGGIAVSISRNLGIPFSFLGTGEKYTDLEEFRIDTYLDSLIGEE